MLAVLAAASLPALLDPGVMADLARLHALAGSPHPYFVPEHALRLYLWAPLVALSACSLFLAPGLLLALKLGRADTAGAWLLHGLGASIAVLVPSTALLQLVDRVAESSWALGRTYGLFVLLAAFLSITLPARRLRSGQEIPFPGRQELLATLSILFLLCFACIGALAPKFHWESFNGDGVHAYEATRLLLKQVLPFFPAEASTMNVFPGMTSMLFAFPGSWFLRLFGEVEAAARIPFLLYLAGLYGGLVALIGRPVSTPERIAIAVALAVYALVMAFSATYSPYCADIALPATQDTLLVVCFLGFVHAFGRGSPGWMGLFALFTYTSLPSGSLLLGFFLLSAWAVWRPRPWRRLALGLGSILACMVLGALTSRVLRALDQPVPGTEYFLRGLIERFELLQFTDWRRFLFAAVPGGIAPFVGLFFWRRQGRDARTLTLVCALYFAFFYVQAFVALHYFVPVMLLPIAVYWGCFAGSSRALAAALVTLALSLWLSAPEHSAPYTAGRLVGASLENRFDDGHDDGTAFNSSEHLAALFPKGWDRRVPEQAYGDSPIVWLHYAARARDERAEGRPGLPPVNYVVQPLEAAPPEEFHLQSSGPDWAVYLRDESIWEQHQSLRPPSPAGGRLYAIPRDMLFGIQPIQQGPKLLDLKKLVRSITGS